MRNRTFAYAFISDLRSWQASVKSPTVVVYRNTTVSNFNTAMSFIGPKTFFQAIVDTHTKETLRETLPFLLSPWLGLSEYKQLTAYFTDHREDVQILERLIENWLAENA